MEMNIHNMSKCEKQTHVHEFEASTHLAETGEDRHNHRFAGVTGEVIPLGNGKHKHELRTNTDFFVNHHHQVIADTGPNISVSSDKHVHFVHSFTTFVDGHKHEVEFATLIGPSPLT